MSYNPKDFDKAAATWDLAPQRLKLVEDVSLAIAAEVALTPDLEVLDFGCGTGLLTLRLQPLVGRITGADTSRGMLDTLREKLKVQGIGNVGTILLDQDQSSPLPGAYDLIISNMTLHHVADVQALLVRLCQAIKPGGHLCLTDLDLDGGQFHEDSQGVFHDGFDRSWLRKQLEGAGLVVVSQRTAATMTKPARDGELRAFTVFLTTGRKPTA